nr:sugar isomerase [uncultured Schaedlerella sp.]
MYNFRKLVLGYAPTRRFDFPEPKNAYENSVKIKKRVYDILKGMGDIEIIDLSFLNEEALLYQECDVERAAEEFTAKKVDALFIPHANFGCEEVVVKLCRKLKLPVLIWGPRDDAPPGGYCYRQTDTQCGLFATTMGLLRENIPFSYIENCWLDSPILDQELEKFIRVACAVKSVKNMKICQIGPRPRDFLSVIVDEAAMVNQLGIDLVPVDGTELISEMEHLMKNKNSEVQKLVKETREKFGCYTISDGHAEKLAAVELAILNLAEKYGCTVAAGDCWYATKLAYGTNPCFAFGNLTEKGLPTVCETDVYGAVTAGLLAGVSRYETPSFTADMTIRHPENDNAELLWHCGPFPRSLAKEECRPELNDSCMGRYEIRGGDVTIARLGSLNGKFKLFFGEGKGVDGPVTGGNYLWFEADDWAKWERKLMYGPYIHHTCGIHGRYAQSLQEACRYLNIEADPVQ